MLHHRDLQMLPTVVGVVLLFFFLLTDANFLW